MRVTVQWVNPPRNPDGKFGNIKSSDDKTIMVPVDQLGQFERGKSYDVPIKTQIWGKGPDAKEFTVIAGNALPVGFARPPEQQRSMARYQEQATNFAQPYPAAQGSPPDDFPPSDTVGRDDPPPPPVASYAPPRGNPEARGIFATGIVGRAMGSGKFTASEIEVLLQAALEAYDRRMGG